MKTVLRLTQRFGALNTQFQQNKSRNAVRFETQNILWDHEQVNYHVQAFSKGLSSLQFQQNDTFLLRLPSSQQAEAYISKLGTANIGAKLILSQAGTEKEIDQQIQNNNVKAIIFEPTLSFGDDLLIDVLNRLIPELAETRNGQRVSSKKYGSLRSLIQTNFYSFPGVNKFRSMMNYADDKYYKISNATDFEPVQLPESSNSIFVTNPASDLAFRAGVLNSNINGRYLVVVEPHQVNRIAELHDYKVDLIATEQIPHLNDQVNVYLEKGSKLYQGRKNRVQI